MDTYKIADREFQVLDSINVRGYTIPVLNIRMMSDERERELSRSKEATV